MDGYDWQLILHNVVLLDIQGRRHGTKPATTATEERYILNNVAISQRNFIKFVTEVKDLYSKSLKSQKNSSLEEIKL